LPSVGGPEASGLQQQIVADRIKTGRIDEGRQLDLANVLRRTTARLDGLHDAVAGNHHIDRVIGNSNCWVEQKPVIGDQLAVLVDREIAGPRVGLRSIGQINDEKAVAGNGDVETAFGVHKAALLDNAIGGAGPHPAPTWMPVGTVVPALELCAPGRCKV
jgi:hypothetical protein